MARFKIYFGQQKVRFYLRPDADDTTDGWTDELAGTTDIYLSIDESTLSDSDYVISPPVASATADLVVRLYAGVTEIAEWTHTNIADTFVTAAQELTDIEFAAISDFSDLFVELDDNQGSIYRFSLGDPSGGVKQSCKLRYRYKRAT